MRPSRLLAIAAPFVVAVTLVAACSSSDHGPALPPSTLPPLDAKPDAALDGRLDATGETDTSADADATKDASDAGESRDAGDVGEVDGAVDETSHIHDTGPADGDTDEVAACGLALTTSTVATCSVTVQSWNDEGHAHADVDADVTYCTKPPSSGAHFGIWASFRTYDHPIPWGYLVHSMEHGAVVIAYQCASGSCPSIAAPLQAIIDARPVDPLCDVDAGVRRRVILVPDPTLDVPIAAAAWTWTYRASCIDAASLGAFIDAHYGKATEDFCSDGIAP